MCYLEVWIKTTIHTPTWRTIFCGNSFATNGNTEEIRLLYVYHRHTEEIRLLYVYRYIFIMFWLNTISYICVTQSSLAGFDIYRKESIYNYNSLETTFALYSDKQA